MATPEFRPTTTEALRRAASWLRTLIARNFLLKLLSLAIAVLLWGMVREEQDVAEMAQVYLKIARPEEMLFLDPVPSFVNVRLVGPRSRLRQAQQTRLEMTIDVGATSPGDNTFNIANYQIRNLPPGLSTASFHPSVLKLRVDVRGEKAVPVRATLKGNVAVDHEIAAVTVEPEAIGLEGARSHLEALTEIPTAPIDVSQLDHDQRIHVGLDYGELYVWPHKKLDGVDVDLRVRELRSERVFDAVPVRLPDGLAERTATPEAVAVTVEGLRSKVEALRPEDVQVALPPGAAPAEEGGPVRAEWLGAAEEVPAGRVPLVVTVTGVGAGLQIRAVEPAVVTVVPGDDHKGAP